MSKLSERQRLILTIAVGVLLTGGLVALILKDRGEIKTVRDEIASLDQRIRAADVEIKKTRDRENRVLVFRAVENRELAVLPTRQKIASFHRNLSTFLASAGLRFQELPESEPKDSGLAKGIFVTRSALSFQGDSASTLRFVNMMENDPRLVAIKGLTLDAGQKNKDDPTQPVIHDGQVHIETYFYNPGAVTMARMHIPSAEARLQEPEIKAAIAAFQPERPDSYTLRPSASRRDPLVDPRVAAPKVDEEELKRTFEQQETIVLEIEAQLNDINERVEQEKALGNAGDVFRQDRVQAEVDVLLNEVNAYLAQIDQNKSITLPELAKRLERVREATSDLNGRRPPRILTVPRHAAERTYETVESAFVRGDYTEVSNLVAQWSKFIEGKAVDADAVELSQAIVQLRPRAKRLAEFQSIPLRVTGTIVHPMDPGRSVALVNGRPLHVGERLSDRGDVLVTEITREAVIFEYKGEAIRVRRRRGGPDDKPRVGAVDVIEPAGTPATLGG